MEEMLYQTIHEQKNKIFNKLGYEIPCISCVRRLYLVHRCCRLREDYLDILSTSQANESNNILIVEDLYSVLCIGMVRIWASMRCLARLKSAFSWELNTCLDR